MNEVVLYTLITLGGIGAVAAIILFFVAQKFKVIEDPRIDDVEEALPSANCGGCGYPGCRNFAEACVKTDDLGTLFCPVGGNETMSAVAEVLGMTVEAKEPQVAVLLCNGSSANRKRTSEFNSAANCTIAANTYGGDTDCTYGCLGLGECVDACGFDAMYMDEETGLPVVIEDKCTACGACVAACPKDLFQLRNKGKKSRRIYVACMNKDKGAPAKKACDVACIGCSKCFKECKYDAITMADNKAYIDYTKCVICRACVPVCPTGAIHEINLPLRKAKKNTEEKAKTEAKPVAAKPEIKKEEVSKPSAEKAEKPAKEAPKTETKEIEKPKQEEKPVVEDKKENNSEDKSSDENKSKEL